MLQTMEQSLPTPIQYASPPTPPASNTGSPAKASPVLAQADAAQMTIPSHHHILIVTGPAGCGKSTIAKYLSERYGFDYIEGDEVSR
jgi:gluconokinase